jgi:hypothetical protein
VTPAEAADLAEIHTRLDRAERQANVMRAALTRLESRFASVDHHDTEALMVAAFEAGRQDMATDVRELIGAKG